MHLQFFQVIRSSSIPDFSNQKPTRPEFGQILHPRVQQELGPEPDFDENYYTYIIIGFSMT